MNNNLNSDDIFRDYLKSEYNNIAEAHFRTNEAISSFFRYYLLIMSAPIAIAAAFISLTQDLSNIIAIVRNLNILVAATIFVISAAGFGVMLYIINLRMDAILYARAVNSIRKYYYDHSTTGSIGPNLRMRVLPQSSSEPKYFELQYFLPNIGVFALINSLYLVICTLILFLPKAETLITKSLFSFVPLLFWVIPCSFFLMHFVAYVYYAHYREYSYLRSFALGVDIDGVLNKHRDHFCALLKDKTQKILDPERITTIPIHDCPRIGVSREDEKLVFNDVGYWTRMIPDSNAAKNLQKIRNMNVKIYIFSHRPWPNTANMSESSRRAIHKEWYTSSMDLLNNTYKDDFFMKGLNHLRLNLGISELSTNKILWYRVNKKLIYWFSLLRYNLGRMPIEQITESWLNKQQIEYAKLTIERGNEDVADPQGHFRNRYDLARRRRIRYFVEDDIEKAIKLAYICDVVFLIEHPYNIGFENECEDCDSKCKREKIELPPNIIKVRSWDDIYKSIRSLS